MSPLDSRAAVVPLTADDLTFCVNQDIVVDVVLGVVVDGCACIVTVSSDRDV